MSATDSDLLRQMVRQVLREIVPETMSAAPQPILLPEKTEELVSIANDAELTLFAQHVASASEEERAAIADGVVTFRLAAAARGAAEGPAGSASGTGEPNVVRIESGAVTERHVRDAAAARSRIVLGRKAVLTPLARDRARAAGVDITRER